MISRLLLVGATGDLAGRLVLPGLARLLASGEVGSDLQVTGAAPQDLDEEAFARHIAARLDEHAADLPVAARSDLVSRLRYARVDLGDPRSLAQAARTCSSGTPLAVYLALPPRLFPVAVAALEGTDLPPGSRIVVEKPFGEDLPGAVRLNALLAAATAGAPGAAYRVDHALGLPGVADLLDRRGPGSPLSAVWNGAGIERVEVRWEETIALEGRADFFDRAGMLRDVVANHLLQLLVLATMELPCTSDDADPSGGAAAKLDLLRSLAAPPDQAPEEWTQRARYTAGALAGVAGHDGRTVPDYAAELGVDAARRTETFAELVLVSSAPRWAGTRFVLRAGKALGADRKGVLLHLRDDAATRGRQVWIDLEEASTTGGLLTGQVSAYAAVLSDVLGGRSRLSVGAAESEQAWRVVAPALQAWARDDVPLQSYPAGSAGPDPLALA